MAVIELEHGRYEADTLDAALKLSKQGERRAKLAGETGNLKAYDAARAWMLDVFKKNSQKRQAVNA